MGSQNDSIRQSESSRSKLMVGIHQVQDLIIVKEQQKPAHGRDSPGTRFAHCQNGSITQLDRKEDLILGPSQCYDALMLVQGKLKWLNHTARTKGRTNCGSQSLFMML